MKGLDSSSPNPVRKSTLEVPQLRQRRGSSPGPLDVVRRSSAIEAGKTREAKDITLEDLTRLSDKYEGEDVEQLHESMERAYRGYQLQAMTMISEGVHYTNLAASPTGLTTQTREDINQLINLNIPELRKQLNNSESFKKKKSSIHYMIKRADFAHAHNLNYPNPREDRIALTNYVVALLTNHEGKAFSLPPQDQKLYSTNQKRSDSGSQTKDTTHDGATDPQTSGKQKPSPLASGSETKDTTGEGTTDPQTSGEQKQHSQELIDLWLHVYKLIDWQRDFKSDFDKHHTEHAREFRTLRRLTERLHMENRRAWAYVKAAHLYRHRKRNLKEKLAVAFGKEDLRTVHLKEEERNKLNKKIQSSFWRWQRYIRRRRPYDQLLSRPRGKIGQEIGYLREMKEEREKRQDNKGILNKHQTINSISAGQVMIEIGKLKEHHISKEGKDSANAKKFTSALEFFQHHYYSELSNLIPIALSELHADTHAELLEMKRRIKAMTLADMFTVSATPVFVVGFGLTIIPLAAG